MTRQRDGAGVAEARRLYGLGLSTRAVAAQVGADPRTVQRWLADADVIRPRGPRPVISPGAVREARTGRKLPWGQVAASLGVSKTGARKAYRRGYGDAGQVDHHQHLTGRQAAGLRALWDTIPPPAGGGAGHSMDTDEGRRARDLLLHYRRAGVTAAELGKAIGVSRSRVCVLTSGG